MNAPNPENDLRDALTEFETSVTTPVVSGELTDWAEKARNAWGEARAQVDYHVKTLHPRQYEEIAKQDAALLRQVELMTTEDQAIAQQMQQLDKTVARVAQRVPQLEPDEAKAAPHVKDFADEAVQFVARVRKQAVALQTWYVEAFDRERGGGD